MKTVPISDLPQPSISSELPEPLSVVSKPSHPFCVSASGTELSDYYSVIAKHRSAIYSILSMFQSFNVQTVGPCLSFHAREKETNRHVTRFHMHVHVCTPYN